MNRDHILGRAEILVREKVQNYDRSHDWWHIERVRSLARIINESEKLEEPFLVDLAALFHDFADSKFSGENPQEAYDALERFLSDHDAGIYGKRIADILKYVSFSKRLSYNGPDDRLLKIVQDADRLDAMGAIGISRAFSYGGFRNNPIYDPGNDGKSVSTISHFHDKLLRLESMMNTSTGKRMARERHEFLELFLSRFFEEWKILGDQNISL